MKKLHLKVNIDIELQVPSMEDAGKVYALVEKNRAHLAPFMAWESKTNSIADIEDYFNRNKHISYYDDDFPLIIRYKDEIIGVIGYNKGNALEKTVDIGYWISKEYSGNGIVTKCCQALINFAFAMTDVQEIYIKCDISNKKSLAIPLKLGFEFVEQIKNGGFVKNGNAEMLRYVLKKPILI